MRDMADLGSLAINATASVQKELSDMAGTGETTSTGMLYRTRLDAAHAVLNTIAGTDAILVQIRALQAVAFVQTLLILLIVYLVATR